MRKNVVAYWLLVAFPTKYTQIFRTLASEATSLPRVLHLMSLHCKEYYFGYCRFLTKTSV